MDGGGFRVAVAQTAPVRGSVEANADAAVDVVRAAAGDGAELVVFPELSLIGYDLALLDDPRCWLAGRDDPRLDGLRTVCRDDRLTAVVGGAVSDADGRRSLAALWLLADGSVRSYAKRHLHGAERDLFEPGERVLPLELGGWRLAPSVCFDAAVPTHAQEAADDGADVYVVSALYTSSQLRRMDVHMAARAMDHGMHVVAANVAAEGWDSCGGSGVWGPSGDVLARAGRGVELVVVDLARDA